MTAECHCRLSTRRGSWRGPFAWAGCSAVCFHYTVGIWTSSAVRNMLGRERASSLHTWGRWEQLPGEPRAGQRQDGDGSACQALGADGRGKKKRVGRTCKQSRSERKLIGGNFIWNAEALFLERLCFLLTTEQQLNRGLVWKPALQRAGYPSYQNFFSCDAAKPRTLSLLFAVVGSPWRLSS